MVESRGPCLVLAALLLAGGLHAEDFYDYAEVTSVEPLADTAWQPDAEAPCPREPTGAGDGASSLVDALGGDLDLAVCDARRPPRERIAGYRVTYRYGGSDYVHVLDSDPGPLLKVRVRVEAD